MGLVLVVAYDVSALPEGDRNALENEAVVQAEASENDDGTGHGDVAVLSFVIESTLEEVYARVSPV